MGEHKLSPEQQKGLVTLAEKIFEVRVFSCWGAQQSHPEVYPFAVFDRAKKADPATCFRVYAYPLPDGGPWRPHEDRDDAVRLCEWLASKGYEVEVTIGSTTTVRVWFTDYDGERHLFAEECDLNPFPETVFLAALAAVSPDPAPGAAPAAVEVG
jgi:hypothetical protein